MEALGLVLAVVPLIICAAEHYEDCCQTLKRFVHFSKDIYRFQLELAVQKTTFVNQCCIILATAQELNWKQSTGNNGSFAGDRKQKWNVACDMLRNKDSTLWDDENFLLRIQEQLGTSLEVIKALLEHIISLLLELTATSREFERAVERAAISGRAFDKIQIRIRWKTTFSHTHLDRLQQLERANGQLQALYNQSKQLEIIQKHDNPLSTVRLQALERYRSIQQASQTVYRVLARSCCEHTEHLTRMCLEVTTEDSQQERHMIFRVAFAKRAFLAVKAPFESSSPSEEIVNGSFCAVRQTLGRLSNPKQAVGQNAQGAFLQSLPPEYSSKIESSDSSEACTLSSLGAEIGPCSRFQINHNAQADLVQSPKPPVVSICLGSSKLNLLPTFPERSLYELLDDLAAQGPMGRLSRPALLHLARLLATGVLQYNRTPWLHAWWRSSDIFLRVEDVAALAGDDVRQTHRTLPHIAVRVRDLQYAPPSRSPTFPLQGLARNPVLYGLGILLLELAYSAPLPTLMKSSGTADMTAFDEWKAVQRLAARVSGQLGPTFAGVVRRCLFCNFGCDEDDLDNEEMQTAFYETVVRKLELAEEESLKLFA
jgi:hypothetical protein